MENKMNSFVMIPSSIWEGIINDLKEIKDFVKIKDSEVGLSGYVTEDEAKKMLGRKTTWFWNLRKSGKLTFSKIGSKIYYNKLEIAKLLNESIS